MRSKENFWKRIALMLFAFIIVSSVWAQEASESSNAQVLRGRVLDYDGSPLMGANVVANGRYGCSTDEDGFWELKVAPNREYRLYVTFVGNQPAEYVVKASQEAVVRVRTITMKADDKMIEEVVVNGMFERRAESYTGSAVTIKKDELRAVGNTNVLQSLKNLDPSFHFTENLSIGSNPNAMPDITLRGQSGFPDLNSEYATNPNTPLFIVDGFETSLTKVIDMDMNRVASVTILKDAAAKAIYGSKAANGVVVIETVRPESGKLRVSYTGSVNFNFADLSSYDLTNAAEKLEVEKNAGLYTYEGYNGVWYWENAARQYLYSVQYNELFGDILAGVNTDWKSKPVRNSIGHKHTLYVEGGTDEFQYGLDLAYNNVAGVMKGSDRNTFSGGLTFSYRYKKLLFRDNLEVMFNQATNSPYGTFNEYTSMNPYYRPYDENGNVIKDYTIYSGSWGTQTITNPLWNTTINTKDQNQYSQFTNNLYLEYKFTNSLKLTGRLGITRQDSRADVFHPASHTDFVSYTTEELVKRRGLYTYTDGSNFRVSTDITMNYSKHFAEKHMVFANLGWSTNSSTIENAVFRAEGFPNDRLDNIGFARAYYKDSAPTATESTSHDAGAIGAINYSLSDKYLADASFRLNGSSQFGSENRWGKFWSVGLGWNLHNEEFIKKLELFDQLKLRASYGFTGSQNFNSYQSLATYKYYTETFYDGYAGAYLLAMANSKLKWQRKEDADYGFDLQMFKRRLTARFDYYVSTTDDLLTDVTLPSSTGFKSYKENLGKVVNQGVELYLSGRVYQHERDYVNIYANVVHNSNKIKQISNSLMAYNKQQTQNATNKPVVRYAEGQSMTAIWAVPSMGIDPATGREVYVKQDGSTTFDWNNEDLDICGDTEASIYGNVGIQAGWNGFILNVGMTYQLGGQLYNQTKVDRVENADLTKNVDRRIFTDRWVKPGDKALYKYIEDTGTTYATSRFVEDNNVLNLSSVNLSYDFDRFKCIKESGFDRLRLSFDMQDIARLSSIKIERGTSYPYAKSFAISLQAIF